MINNPNKSYSNTDQVFFIDVEIFLFYFLLHTYGRQSIVLGSDFGNGGFDECTRFQVP